MYFAEFIRILSIELTNKWDLGYLNDKNTNVPPSGKHYQDVLLLTRINFNPNRDK